MKKAIKLSLGRGKETTTAGINYGLCIVTLLGWDTYLLREKEWKVPQKLGAINL